MFVSLFCGEVDIHTNSWNISRGSVTPVPLILVTCSQNNDTCSLKSGFTANIPHLPPNFFFCYGSPKARRTPPPPPTHTHTSYHNSQFVCLFVCNHSHAVGIKLLGFNGGHPGDVITAFGEDPVFSSQMIGPKALKFTDFNEGHTGDYKEVL